MSRRTLRGGGSTGTLLALQYALHGSTASTVRPTTSGPVYWIGTVAPTNALQNDVWLDTTTTPSVEKIRGATGFPGSYEPRIQAYNCNEATLRKFHALLAKAYTGSALINILAMGDSTTSGVGATTQTCWPTILMRRMAEKGYALAGTGFNLVVQSTRWTRSGYSTTLNANVSSTTAGHTCTFTADIPGTVATVYYLSGGGAAGGVFTVSIDGGAAVTVTVAGGTAGISAYQVTGLSNATHTIVVTHVSGTTYIAGGSVNQTSGLVIDNLGLSGYTSHDFNNGSDFTSIPFLQTYLAAKATIIQVGLNDYNQQKTLSSVSTDYQAILTRALATGPALLATTWEYGNQGLAIPYTSYNAQIRGFADANGLPLLDLEKRYGPSGTMSPLGILSDAVHLNAVGYADVAAAYSTLLEAA